LPTTARAGKAIEALAHRLPDIVTVRRDGRDVPGVVIDDPDTFVALHGLGVRVVQVVIMSWSVDRP
jgi:hypothetical protein